MKTINKKRATLNKAVSDFLEENGLPAVVANWKVSYENGAFILQDKITLICEGNYNGVMLATSGGENVARYTWAGNAICNAAKELLAALKEKAENDARQNAAIKLINDVYFNA